jgi:hypothetical protein
MNDVRDLLIECRMELRRKIPDFLSSRLSRRLTDTIAGLGSASGVPQTRAQDITQQAWRAAVREIKETDPAIYDRVMLKVLSLLRSEGLRQAEMDLVAANAAQAQEIAALRAELAAAQAALHERAA